MVLIDCGVSYKKLKDERFNLVLLTHAHSDHLNASTIRALAENRPLLRFGCPGYLIDALFKCGVSPNNIDVIYSNELVKYGNNLSVKAFDLVHDINNVGYSLRIGDSSVLYMTDTGSASNAVTSREYDYYFIEANYKEAELQQRISEKMKSGVFCYETRVAETHLSEEQAVIFISENARPDSKVIYIHQHQEVNQYDQNNDS